MWVALNAATSEAHMCIIVPLVLKAPNLVTILFFMHTTICKSGAIVKMAFWRLTIIFQNGGRFKPG